MNEKTISDIADECERTDLYIAIIEALSKQIPQPVKATKHRLGLYDIEISQCPNCGATLILEKKHCSDCGQKLEWPIEREVDLE